MKKNVFKVLTIALAVVFAVFFTACSEDPDNNNGNNGNNNGGGVGTHDIDSALYGTWRNDSSSLIITFSSDGITWGGAVGSSYNSLPVDKWTAKNGKIDYTYSGSTTTVWNYTINGSGQLVLTSQTSTHTLVKDGGSGPAVGGTSMENAIQLTENQWTDGNISTSGGQQWFMFTATASTQYIHVTFGTLTDLYVQLYNSSGNTTGSNTNLYGSTLYTSRSLTSGQKYYIKVTPYSGSGTYQIAFNTSNSFPISGGGDSWTWTVVSNRPLVSSTSSIRGIAYGNGKFVAVGNVGNDGAIAYSTNGESWTAVSTNIFMDINYVIQINSIAYGNGRFVAVGSSGKMAYSTDGVNWTAVTNKPFNGSIRGIVYGNDKFVAVARGIAYSTDGVNWTVVSNALIDLFSIAYGNGKFVALGEEYDNLNFNWIPKTVYSTDGITWTTTSNIPFTSDNISISIAYGNGKFVVVGSSGYPDYIRKMAYSADGINWTAVSNSLSSSDIAYGNGRFVAVGGRTTYSADGVNWTAITNSQSASKIAYGNGRFVAVSNDRTMYADW